MLKGEKQMNMKRTISDGLFWLMIVTVGVLTFLRSDFGWACDKWDDDLSSCACTTPCDPNGPLPIYEEGNPLVSTCICWPSETGWDNCEEMDDASIVCWATYQCNSTCTSCWWWYDNYAQWCDCSNS